MNAARAIETAMVQTLRAFADLGKGTVVRGWQNLRIDNAWRVDPITGADKTLPLVDVRCSPPRPDDSQHTVVASCRIDAMTNAEEDRDHLFISAMYDAIQETCERMRQASLVVSSSCERLAMFTAALAEEMPQLKFGGLSYGDPTEPFDDDGVNVIGLTLNVHYSLADYETEGA
jgi:hypothetical protein